MMMETYYRARASEYDRFYENPERQEDLAQLRDWLTGHARGRTILEVAAGTGFWTQVAAPVAKAIMATDLVPETLAVAANRGLGQHVNWCVADAYALPKFALPFDAGMAHMWWSHVEKQRRFAFLSDLTAHLEPESLILMIDQTYVDGICTPVSRLDEWGNRYTLRKLGDGAVYEIVKNYPSDEELHDAFERFGEDIRIMRLHHFWALTARKPASSA